ncbi:Predicted arabinose efflux permease, MFS family [Ruegeria halocynthiae]|uniref:Predicted arabinose efflux permease, MFS family n=1 Tax=Ruegeria halocynthiae TaxID=985054 RepID=A0A1H3EYR5_9RHOB|nr:YbfB/YjiJ family MFS transporter [Ruegeria halocynthiae]SDX83044.1 Predicted arabinose efflux permease, MFS family [Ruegeria halocynthiae]
MTSAKSTNPWLILLGLALGVSISNAFGRFAYGLILPSMKSSLGWSLTQSGWLNTANSIGYIVGSILTLLLIRHVSPSRLFAGGTVATAFCLLATGFDESLVFQTVCRTLVGLFGALSFVSGGVLAASLFQSSARKNALAIALYFGGGGGFGIALCGASLPPMLDVFGPQSWDWAWIGLGITALVICPFSIWASAMLSETEHNAELPSIPPVRRMLGELSGYGLFGLGYIVYVTFISVWMKEQHSSVLLTTATWMILGFSIMVSPFVWRGVLARFAPGTPLALILSGVAFGSALPILVPNGVGLILSALVFGLSVFMPPTAVTSFVRQNVNQPDWGATVSFFTVVFAISQALGPIGAGIIGDITGEIGDSLVVASVVLLVGALFAAMQKPLRREAM